MNDRHHPAGKPPRPDAPPTASTTPRMIGEHVRAARIAAHLTQQELAGTTFSKSYISAVERGKMTPSFQALSVLAERLGVTLSYLLGEEARQAAVEVPNLSEAPTAPAGDDQQTIVLNEAEQLLHEGRYEEALALFEQAGQPERTSQARESVCTVSGRPGTLPGRLCTVSGRPGTLPGRL